jgi:hypothetical protein
MPHDSVVRMVAEVLSTAASSDGHATMMEVGTWELINVWQDRHGEGENNDAPATYENGIWEVPELVVKGCTTWYMYQWVPEEGGGGEPPDAPPPPSDLPSQFEPDSLRAIFRHTLMLRIEGSSRIRLTASGRTSPCNSFWLMRQNILLIRP